MISCRVTPILILGMDFYDIITIHQIYTHFLVTDTHKKKVSNFNHDDHALIMFKLRKKCFAFVVDFLCYDQNVKDVIISIAIGT